jgi:hypothetical protein
MFEKITEYDIYGGGYKSDYYNMYCYKKDVERINKLYNKKYDYDSIVKLTKLKNKYYNNWFGKSEISSGIPYGVVVFNLNYRETYETNFYMPIEGECDTKRNYELSLNEWKGIKTLQLKIKCKDDINKKIKDVLQDCYDNMIIIDFGFDYILVIEELPLYSYNSVIDESKHNNNYIIKYYYYDDKYVSKYLNNYKKRDSFDDLIELFEVEKPKKVINTKQKIYDDICRTLKETDLSKAKNDIWIIFFIYIKYVDV